MELAIQEKNAVPKVDLLKEIVHKVSEFVASFPLVVEPSLQKMGLISRLLLA